MKREIGLVGLLLLVGCGDNPSNGAPAFDAGTGGAMAGDGGTGSIGGSVGGESGGSGGAMAPDGSGGAGPALPPVPIRAHERVTFVGDSLTSGYNGALSWPTGPGNFIDQVNAILGAGNEIIATENGKAGIGIDYLTANISTMVFESDPTLVILWIGVNDSAGVGTDDFTNKYTMYLAQIKAWKPSVKIICLGLGPRGSEYWQLDSKGHPMWSPIAPSLDTYDVYIQQAAASMGAMFVNWRKWLLAWEMIHNPGAGDSGFATVDGTHYNDTGQKQLAAAILQPPICTVSP